MSTIPHSSRAAWTALLILTVVTFFAFIDRTVLVMQAEIIKKALSLSDFQLGFMQGTSVALFAAVAAFPIGWLADRYDRRWVLAGCVVFWSLAVAGSAFAQNYAQLLLCSALVGAGEAGLVPIVYAMIPQLFPERQRQLANSVYSVGSSAVGALALAITGLMVGNTEAVRALLPGPLSQMDGWRIAFIMVAAPAPIMLVLLACIRLAPRPVAATPVPEAPSPAAPGPAADRGALIAHFKAHAPVLASFYGGVALAIFGFNCIGSWLAVIYARVFGQTPQQVGSVLGVMALGATVVGFLFTVYGLPRLRARMGSQASIRVLWVSVAIAAACFSLMPLARVAQQMYAIQGVFIFLTMSAAMIYPTVLQTLGPGPIRARMSALMTMITSGLVAIAPPLVGFVSDQLPPMQNGLIVASVSVAVPVLLVSIALLLRAEKLYPDVYAAVRRLDQDNT